MQVWEEANREYHSAIKQPTLLIIGTRDNFVSLSEVQETEEVIIILMSCWDVMIYI